MRCNRNYLLSINKHTIFIEKTSTTDTWNDGGLNAGFLHTRWCGVHIRTGCGVHKPRCEQFTSYTTFAVLDKVVKISNETVNAVDGDFEPEYLPPTYSAAILTSIRSNMQDAEYIEVDKLELVLSGGSASLSGIQYRYLNSYLILVSGTYYASQAAALRPYSGLGIGTIAQDKRVDMGIFSREKTHWQFALRPELGLMYRTAQYVGFKFGAKYYQSFSKDDLDGQSFIGLDFEIIFSR